MCRRRHQPSVKGEQLSPRKEERKENLRLETRELRDFKKGRRRGHFLSINVGGRNGHLKRSKSFKLLKVANGK